VISHASGGTEWENIESFAAFANGLVGNFYPTLKKHLTDISQAKLITMILPYSITNYDLGGSVTFIFFSHE